MLNHNEHKITCSCTKDKTDVSMNVFEQDNQINLIEEGYWDPGNRNKSQRPKGKEGMF
jgi:hypothetical protein